MADPTTPVQYEFLDRDGVLQLAESILANVNIRITERIVNTIDENSDAVHVPSAAAVYAAISAKNHTRLLTHTGSIDEITNPATDAIYLQRDDVNDTTWMMYVWAEVQQPAEPGVEPTVAGQWISIGSTEISLENYWSKSDADMAALKEQLGINALNTAMEDKVSNSQMVALTATDINSIIGEAFTSTEILNPATPPASGE